MYRNLLPALGLFAAYAAKAQWIWEDPPGLYLLEMKGENWVHRQKVVVH